MHCLAAIQYAIIYQLEVEERQNHHIIILRGHLTTNTHSSQMYPDSQPDCYKKEKTPYDAMQCSVRYPNANAHSRPYQYDNEKQG